MTDPGSMTCKVDGNFLIGIGDLHGHYPALVKLLLSLQEEYTIFSDLRRKILREGVTLVLTGDYIDRGNQALQIIDTLQELNLKNPKQVYTLMGNHELLALADLDSVRCVDANQGWGQIGYDLVNLYGSSHVHNGGLEFIQEFGATPKRGIENYLKRMESKGDIGKWMRKLKPCFLASYNNQRILFSHADIPDAIGTHSGLREFHQRFDKHIAQGSVMLGGSYAKYTDEGINSQNSLFWGRRFSHLSESEVEMLIAQLGVDYLVVGHTAHKSITTYYNTIFDIDVGMTPRYGENEPAALVVKPQGIFSFYANSGESLLKEF